MSGLSDVCSVEAVVIGHVGMVVVLQGHHVGDERVHRDPERLQQISLLPPRQQKKNRSQKQTASFRKQFHPAVVKGQLFLSLTWKMANIMQLRGRLLDNSAT